MDNNKIFLKIKELGSVNSKRDELREYCKLKMDQIVKFLPRRILNSDGGNILDCLLNGLPDNPTSSKNKVKIVDIVLQSMRKESTSLTHCGDVISRLCLELPRLPAADLMRWSNDSIQSIIEDNDVNMIYKDVLPECLSALSAHCSVQHCGTEMTIPEYKEQCVRALCQCRWKERQLVTLTAMFRDMQLPRSDHRLVVNKICTYIIDAPPDTLPPLVHQLLKLCKTYHVEVVLAHLSHYFSVRLYSKLEPPPQDSDATTLELEDIVQHSPAELSRCLSTCLYHMSMGAAEPELIRRHLKAWPKTQLLRNPFLVDLALALSDKGADFRTVCLDVIKSAIERRVTDELKSKECVWTRSVIPPDVDVSNMLKVLTTESANHRELTVVGLINLAFSLLSVPKAKPAAQACWMYGKLILVRLSKAQPETAPHTLSQLCDRLATAAGTQYSDCLHVLCALTPVSLERCTQLTTILENCQPVPGDYKSAAAVLDAVHPLVNFSTRVRDVLVMVCRKGLYSRDSMHRCLALSGFLTVLRHVKISRAFSSSQSVCSEQYSAQSYLTQLQVDVHASQSGSQVTSRVRNEALCMEVVSILRRCLGQDAMVKELLYSKLYECAKEKPVLHEAILELLYEHLSKYLPDSESEPPILFDKCVQVTPITAVLSEPVSRLLYVIAQFLQTSEEEDLEDILASQSADTGSAYLKSKLTSVMDKLCKASDIGKISITEEPGLTDLTPESKAKSIKVQQILSCYESLIAHQIMQWNNSSESAANAVIDLFKAYSNLLEQTKAQPKIGKKGSKSTLNETKETVKSQKSQKTQKDKGKAPTTKISNLVKDRAGPFKPLPCVWDLKVCYRVLELLYNDSVSWCSLEQRNQVRSKREFHQWALKCCTSALAAVTDKRAARGLINIATLLYARVVCRFQDMCDFDDQVAWGCMELFKECLTLLLTPQFALKLDSFLPAITNLQDSPPSICIATILGKIHASLVQIEEESVAEENDRSVKKLVCVLVQTAAVLLETHVPPSPQGATILTKLEEYVRSSKQECLPLVPPLLTAAYRELKEAPFLDALLLKLSAALGRIDEEDTSAGEDPGTFPSIDARTGHTAVAHVCAHLSARHRCIEHLLHRARDLATALATATTVHQQRIHRELTDIYKCIVVQLCVVTSWTAGVSKLRCTVGGAAGGGAGGGGGGSERVLCACVRLYAVLAATAKHIPPDLAPIARFERLLKLSGKKLSTVTDNLITYLEASQQQQNANKVLKDTKLIPRLVLEAELFCKNVILLAGKAKLNYQQYLSLGTARDFRIKGPVLQEALQARREEARDANEDDQADINDAETELLSLPNQNEEEEIEEVAGSDEEGSKRKRKRVS